MAPKPKRAKLFLSSTGEVESQQQFHHYVPTELVTDILERLPIKSIVRFKSVSKAWSALFKTDMFIKNHRNKQGTKGTMLLIRRRCPPPEMDTDVLSFHDLDYPEKEVRPSIPASLYKDKVDKSDLDTEIVTTEFLGSVNGITCIHYGPRYILCNLALRQFKLLPRLSTTYKPPKDHDLSGPTALGFGVCNDTHGFKVILMQGVVPNDIGVVIAHVYDSTTNSWRQVLDAPVYPLHNYQGDVIFFNGACHWPGITFLRDHKMILSFDMTSEVFKQLELPYCLQGFNDCPRPVVLNNCLGLVQYKEIYSEVDPVEIWMMKKYGDMESWIKLFVISPQPTACIFLPWKDDMLMVQEPLYRCDDWGSIEEHDDKFNGQLTSIVLRSNEMKKFQVFGNMTSTRALIYEESLVNLNYL